MTAAAAPEITNFYLSTPSAQFTELLHRAARRHGDKFNPDALQAASPLVRHFYGTGHRVEVTRTYSNGETYVRRGTVSATTGWRPAFLLMHRVSDSGSSDVINADDRVTAVKYHGSRSYVQPSV